MVLELHQSAQILFLLNFAQLIVCTLHRVQVIRKGQVSCLHCLVDQPAFFSFVVAHRRRILFTSIEEVIDQATVQPGQQNLDHFEDSLVELRQALSMMS